MTKYTIQERFFLFAATTLMLAYGYSFYHLHEQDKYINEVLQMNNKRTVRYVEINNELREENNLLRGAIEHWKAMYQASQTSNYQLEQQINLVGEYYRKEIVKVNDELFDLKNTKKIKLSPKKESN